MEWTVHELAERAGISGRTIRHYHQIGLLEPDRVGANGYRYYGADAVARLQRILLLREGGMPLRDIAAVLHAPETQQAEIAALEEHLGQLARERDAIDRRIRAVEHTLSMRRHGREPRMDVMLEGFNDRYRDEVVARWGQQAFDASNQWWHAKTLNEKRQWKHDSQALLDEWRRLQEAGHTPDSPEAQAHAKAHMEWFAQIPGTPIHERNLERSAAMIRGITRMYETNPDFHDTFGTPHAARFAAAALRHHLTHPS